MTLDTAPYRIAPDQSVRLADYPTAYDGPLDKHEAKKDTREVVEEIDALQERLYAENSRALLVVFQAMDAGGKDSTIRSVFGPLNPQGVQVTSFKAPTPIELQHDFLWRVHARAPQHGRIGVFNRSHYEDVLIVRVHGWAEADVVERRYDQINSFEQLLADSGTRIVKFLLHISPDYQLSRFKRRLERPDKHWKFDPGDLEERKHWAAYQDAFETALGRCSPDHAPWYVVPAERRWFRNLLVAQVLRETLEDMNPQYPAPTFDPSEFPVESLR